MRRKADQKHRMLVIDDLSRAHRRAAAARRRLGARPRRRARRPGRPQRRRQDHAVSRHRRRARARERHASTCRRAPASAACRRKRRTARESLIEIVLAADTRAHARCWREARDRARSAPHRRDPDPARRHRRPCRAGARRRHSRRPRLLARRRSSGRARNSPAAGACGWRSPPCCSPSPTCCCSTSRPTISISKARSGSRITSRTIRAPCIVISHDRDLLDNAVDWILHLEAGKLTLYRGGYSAFERQRRERQALDRKLAKKQEAQRAHMQAFVERFRAKATKARQAQSRLKLLAKLEPIAAVVADDVRPFDLPPPAKPLSPPIVALDDVSFGYEPGQPVLRRLTLRIDDDDRIALLGANGNGKSTLVKLIAGRLAPTGGTVTRADKLAGRLFRPAPARRADAGRQRLRPRARADAGRARGQGARARRRHRLSGSAPPTRRSRISRAARSRGCCSDLRRFGGPHLVILDEPTNHLDIDSRAALIEAINDYPGAVMLVSHDRYLLEACADRLWLVADGTVAPFDGDLDDYRRLTLAERGGGGTRDAAGCTARRIARRSAPGGRGAAGRARAAARAHQGRGGRDRPARRRNRAARCRARRARCVSRSGPRGAHLPRRGPRRRARSPRPKTTGSRPARPTTRRRAMRRRPLRRCRSSAVLGLTGFFFARRRGRRRRLLARARCRPGVRPRNGRCPAAARSDRSAIAVRSPRAILAEVDRAGGAGAVDDVAFAHAERDAATEQRGWLGRHRRRRAIRRRPRAAAPAARRRRGGGGQPPLASIRSFAVIGRCAWRP